jgi:hypothetical protein
MTDIKKYIGKYIEYESKIYKVINVQRLETRVYGIYKYYTVIDVFNYEQKQLYIPDSAEIKCIDKIDPSFFKPFQKILRFDAETPHWVADFYSHYDAENVIHYAIGGSVLLDFIKDPIKFVPYNVETAALLGTDDTCDEFYRFWETDSNVAE